MTRVEGPSWRRHLNLSYEQSAMGRMGIVSLGEPAREPTRSSPESLDQPFVLTGADLYRINCRSCHNVGGSGSPPEIKSLLDPVRTTSTAFNRQLMTRRGVTMTDEQIAQLSSQAEASLRERLRNGGEKMPGFSHLRSAESEAMLYYLRELAGVPPGKPVKVTLSVFRVGEEVVKGNCFVCHDATGPGIDAMAASPGLIPSLASFPDQKPIASFVKKVVEGAPAPGSVAKTGRMPIFTYLTAQEVAAAYLYLVAYPPRGPSAP